MIYEIKQMFLSNPETLNIWQCLLEKHGINYTEKIEKTFGLYENNKLVATGSIWRNIIKCVVIETEYQGENLMSILVDHLINEIMHDGFNSCFVYTRPVAAERFVNLGFKEIARVLDKLVFLQKPGYIFDDYIESLERERVFGNKISSIVMNANPFTNGHKYLVQQASIESDIVHLFVLEEDESLFPFDIRLKLVKEGISEFNNVIIHKTGEYIVSSKTFPSYFFKHDDNITKIHALLDATIFKNYIAKSLSITHRYVGEEPLSIATNIYNQAMSEVFDSTLELVVLKRKQFDAQIISATKVRNLMELNSIEQIKNFVPISTYNFIKLYGSKILGDYNLKNGERYE